jgi:hypothetical protein
MRPLHAVVVLAICLSLAAESPQIGAGQRKSDNSKGLPYTEGTVCSLTFVRTKSGMTNDYIRHLAGDWRKLADEMKKDGLIVSYKIFLGTPANKEDWDLMIMYEHKNMAALDGMDEKVHALAARVLGTEEKIKEGYVKRIEIREVLGEKIVREVILK